MTKINRKIDTSRMNQSKEKTMDYVLNAISKEKQTLNPWVKQRTLLLSTFVLFIALVVLLTSPNIAPPGTNPITISAYESEKIAEISYITTSFIGSSIYISNPLLMHLANGDITEFEDNDELVNLYFDTLRVFLEVDVFSESVTVTNVDDHPNSVIILFTVDEVVYELHITFDENDFFGTLIIAGINYEVIGSLEDTDTEFKLFFEAKNGLDFVHIEYESEEKKDELEAKYQVHQRINNIETEKEIKIKNEDDESSVEITEGTNEYQLVKEFENGEFHYKLQYKINEVEGEAIIKEQTDIHGNTTYNYQIKEGDKEKELNQNKPDYDYDEDDEEDEEDNNPNGNSNQNGNLEDESTYYQEYHQLFTS